MSSKQIASAPEAEFSTLKPQPSGVSTYLRQIKDKRLALFKDRPARAFTLSATGPQHCLGWQLTKRARVARCLTQLPRHSASGKPAKGKINRTCCFFRSPCACRLLEVSKHAMNVEAHRSELVCANEKLPKSSFKIRNINVLK